jgi:hypothetical protein
VIDHGDPARDEIVFLLLRDGRADEVKIGRVHIAIGSHDDSGKVGKGGDH